MDFSRDGKRLITADESTINLYDAENAKKLKTLFNKVN
jgi:hypothetical protein